ncbi:MAG: hypothetical protein OEY01_03810 [Desulfobulbaceae bacterium]|nr:hypothetical protein [Desulfobulbaceae bacterium]
MKYLNLECFDFWEKENKTTLDRLFLLVKSDGSIWETPLKIDGRRHHILELYPSEEAALNFLVETHRESAGLDVRSYSRTVVERYLLTRQQQPDRLAGVTFVPGGDGTPFVEPFTRALAQTTKAFAQETPCSPKALN